MRTRGVLVFRHKGILYHFFTLFDSTIEGVGNCFVQDILNSTPTTFDVWRQCLELMEPFLQYKETSPLPLSESASEELKQLLAQLPKVSRLKIYLNTQGNCWLANSYDYSHSILRDMRVACTFVICLDEEVFHAVDWNFRWISRWPLKEIPDDWMTVAKNATGIISKIFAFDSIQTSRGIELANAGYDAAECLEHSVYSSVWHVVERSTGTRLVIKVNEDSAHDREIIVATDILLSHKKPSHLVNVIEVRELVLQQAKSCTRRMAIWMERYDGDWRTLYETTMRPLLPGKKTDYLVHYLAFIKDVVAGIRELHELGYVHYTIKSRNILYRRNDAGGYHFALCDFESACRPLKDQTDESGVALQGSARWCDGWDRFKHTPDYLSRHIVECPPYHVDYHTLATMIRVSYTQDVELLTPILDVLEDQDKDDAAKLQDITKLSNNMIASSHETMMA